MLGVAGGDVIVSSSSTLSEKSSLRCAVFRRSRKSRCNWRKTVERRRVAPEGGLPIGVDAEW